MGGYEIQSNSSRIDSNLPPIKTSKCNQDNLKQQTQNIMKQKLKYLKQIDLFGNHIQLSYDSYQTHKTRFGGCLTLLLIMLSCLAIFYFGQEVINRTNPIVTAEESYSFMSNIEQSYLFNQSSGDGNFFAIKLLDISQENQLNENIVVRGYFTWKQSNSNTIKMKEEVKIIIFSCNQAGLSFENLVNKSEFDFDSMLCFRFSHESDLDSAILEKVQINISLTSSVSAGILEIYHSNLALDLSNFDKPGEYYLIKSEVNFKVGILKRLPVALKLMVLETDNGKILADYSNQEFIISQFQNEMAQEIEIESAENVIASLEFSMDRKTSITKRSYQKFQIFLSQVGGIVKVFSIVFVVLSKKLTKLNFYTHLLNQIFNFEDQSSPDNKNRTPSNSQIKEEDLQMESKDKNKKLSVSMKLVKQPTSSAIMQKQLSIDNFKEKESHLKQSEKESISCIQHVDEFSNSELVENQLNQEDLIHLSFPVHHSPKQKVGGSEQIIDENTIEQKKNLESSQQINEMNQHNQPLEQLEFKKRQGRRNGTLIISKFIHKIHTMINSKNVDFKKIEKIKSKLNKEGAKYIQPENKPLKWGIIDFIQNFFGFGNALKKRQQMEFCWKKVKERLNAVYLMQKLVELEKLKILLLDEHQLKLFDYLPKPMISLNCIAQQNEATLKNSSQFSQSKEKNEVSNNTSFLKKVINFFTLKSNQKQNCTLSSKQKSNLKTSQETQNVQDLQYQQQHSSQNNQNIINDNNQHTFHQQWIQLNARSTPLEKALNAMEAFEMIKVKKNKTHIDIKLVDMLDARMKKCFENVNEYQINEEASHEDDTQNQSQFRQLFDGDNTVRDFLYPVIQQDDVISIRQRSRSLDSMIREQQQLLRSKAPSTFIFNEHPKMNSPLRNQNMSQASRNDSSMNKEDTSVDYNKSLLEYISSQTLLPSGDIYKGSNIRASKSLKGSFHKIPLNQEEYSQKEKQNSNFMHQHNINNKNIKPSIFLKNLQSSEDSNNSKQGFHSLNFQSHSSKLIKSRMGSFKLSKNVLKKQTSINLEADLNPIEEEDDIPQERIHLHAQNFKMFENNLKFNNSGSEKYRKQHRDLKDSIGKYNSHYQTMKENENLSGKLVKQQPDEKVEHQ